MDDFDDELLALAGHGGDTGNKKKSHSYESSRKRRRDDFSDSEASHSDDEKETRDGSNRGETFVNPYPLEGKYSDAADRSRLLGLSEVERESILYEREEELAKLREKRQLADRLRLQRAQQEVQDQAYSSRRSERETALGSEKASKRSQLHELKRKREEKTIGKASVKKEPSEQTRKKRASFSSSEESDSESEVEGRRRKPLSQNQVPTETEEEAAENNLFVEVNDLNKVRMSRKQFCKFLYHPFFPNTVIDCYVRLNIGMDKGQKVYRLCRVDGLTKGSKTYQIDERTPTNYKIACFHGKSVREFDVSYVSDSPFSEVEFSRWKLTMEQDSFELPRKRRIKQKLAELVRMTEHVLSNLEINSMIKARNQFNKIPNNVIAEKTKLRSKLSSARADGDVIEIEELSNELARLEELTAGRGHKVGNELDKLALLNERNRKANLMEIRKVEARAQDARRKAVETGEGKPDPFSRLKTKPKTFYNSTPDVSRPGTPVAADSTLDSMVAASTTQVAAAKAKPLGGIDDVIANGNFELDQDLDL